MSKEFGVKLPHPLKSEEIIEMVSPAGKRMALRASNVDGQLSLIEKNWKYSFKPEQRTQFANHIAQEYTKYAMPKRVGKFQEWLIDTVTDTGQKLGFAGIGLDPEIIVAIEEAFEEAVSFDIEKFHQALFRRLH